MIASTRDLHELCIYSYFPITENVFCQTAFLQDAFWINDRINHVIYICINLPLPQLYTFVYIPLIMVLRSVVKLQSLYMAVKIKRFVNNNVFLNIVLKYGSGFTLLENILQRFLCDKNKAKYCI